MASVITLAVSSHAQSTDASALQPHGLTDPIVISASRVPQPRSAGSVMVDVISRQQIEQSGASNVVEFLDSVPGLSVNRLYGRLGIDASVDVGYMGKQALKTYSSLWMVSVSTAWIPPAFGLHRFR